MGHRPHALARRCTARLQTSARAGGTGLGLAISAELVQAHGGSICVLETSELGTVFEISIPDRTDKLHEKNGRIAKNITWRFLLQLTG